MPGMTNLYKIVVFPFWSTMCMELALVKVCKSEPLPTFSNKESCMDGVTGPNLQMSVRRQERV